MTFQIDTWEAPESVRELVAQMSYEEAWALFKYLIENDEDGNRKDAWDTLCNEDNWIWFATWIVIREYNKE